MSKSLLNGPRDIWNGRKGFRDVQNQKKLPRDIQIQKDLKGIKTRRLRSKQSRVQTIQKEDKAQTKIKQQFVRDDCALQTQLEQNKGNLPLSLPSAHQQETIYEQQILSYLESTQQSIDHTFLKLHRGLPAKTRCYIIKYLYKLHSKYNLRKQTLFLAVHYLDKYLSKSCGAVERDNYATVAQAALFMAAKYEQIYPPQLAEWVDSAKCAGVEAMEAEMLRAFDFRLGVTTLQHYLEYQSKGNVPRRTQLLADLTLFDTHMYQFGRKDLANCIALTANQQNGDSKIILNLKWMTERVKAEMFWLISHKYKDIQSFQC